MIQFNRKDIQGNIIVLLDSTDGAVVARYLYDAWGNQKVVDGSGVEITDPNNIDLDRLYDSFKG